MTQRINITISDELHEKIQNLKGDINVSGVCQNALEKEVPILEAKKVTLDKREQLVMRLRTEKEQLTSEIFNAGKKKGYVQAENLSYETFLELEDLWEHQNSLLMADKWLDPDVLTVTCLPELIEDFDGQFHGNQGIDSDKHFLQQYLVGWASGVLDLWNEIKAEVKK